MIAQRVTARELRQLVESLTAERDRLAESAAMWKKAHEHRRDIHKQNLQVLWQQATHRTCEYGHVDAVTDAVSELRAVIDCIKRVLPRMSEEARAEYFRVFDELYAEEMGSNGAP